MKQQIKQIESQTRMIQGGIQFDFGHSDNRHDKRDTGRCAT